MKPFARRRARIPVLLWLLAVTVGCASGPPAVEQAASTAASTAPLTKASVGRTEKAERSPPPQQDSDRRYQNLTFAPVEVGKEMKFRIRPPGPQYDFPEGESFFQGMELPPQSSTYDLEVTSRLVGSRRVEETHVFYPTLLFLDQDFRMVASIDPGLRPVAIRKFGDVFTARLTHLPEARYLVFYTDKSRLQERMFIRMGQVGPGAPSRALSPGVNVTAQGLHYTNRGATGQLHIRLEKKQ